ncbi:kunitz-type serine protease inhibitor-like [Gigantopelta aegis]|uniref:kunitz-type serine protease inhibitor-like n=1 Tax=Gigantopelta aegis TaxID=1735272 RepID=UPI001B88CF4E|nr:kunitz-type serine protease inhibitor-like [Gigantopelta aegis]
MRGSMMNSSSRLVLVLVVCAVLSASNDVVRSADICHLPKDPGPCDDNLSRFYYNPFTRTCNHFYFGGCRGNANNFLTRRKCMKWCYPD